MAAGLRKIEDTTLKHKLDTTSALINIAGATADNMGTDHASVATISRYEEVWAGLLDFCIDVGDYESGIILHRDKCPFDPLPIQLETAIHYLRFHITKAGQPLLHFQSCEAIKYPSGDPIICRGDWTGKSSIGIYRSALAKLHTAYDSTKGVYLRRCEACARIPFGAGNNHPGCHIHSGSPRLRSTGNSVCTTDFQSHIRRNVRYVAKEYCARSTAALLPAELRQIRAYLLSQNTGEALMIWTMTILGIKLFLRMTEVLKMSYDDFLFKYFVVKPTHVDSLLVQIKGKRDFHPVHFAIWSDDECPDFCPVRALLTWLSFSGIRGGFIFPPAEFIGTEARPLTHYGYDRILSVYKHLHFQVLGVDPNENKSLIIGSHMLRKTAFLFAYWGIKTKKSNNKQPELSDIDQATIMSDARHRDINGTSTYLSDSGTLHTLLERAGGDQPLQRVGRYCPIYVHVLAKFESLCRSAGGGSLFSHLNNRSLGDLADWYTYSILKIDKEVWMSRRISIATVVDVSIQHIPTAHNTSNHTQALQTLLTQFLPHAALERAMYLVAATTQYEVQKMTSFLSQSNPTLVSPPGAMVLQTQTRAPSNPIGATPTRRRSNPTGASRTVTGLSSNVLSQDYQKLLRKASDYISQVSIALLVNDELRTIVQPGQILLEPLKSFAYRCGRIASCVRNCHDGSVQEFVEETTEFRFGLWKCCKGASHKTTFLRKS
jgi:integrase